MKVILMTPTPKTFHDERSSMPLEDERQEQDADEDLVRLKELARERWGNQWTITQKHFADGTTKATAFRSLGQVDDLDDADVDEGMVFECERIRIKGDRVLHDHVYVRNEEVIETVEYEISDVDEISDLDSLEHTKK